MARENPVGWWLSESFGVRGKRNILSWLTAGGLAYWFWILPAQEDAAKRKVWGSLCGRCRRVNMQSRSVPLHAPSSGLQFSCPPHCLAVHPMHATSQTCASVVPGRSRPPLPTCSPAPAQAWGVSPSSAAECLLWHPHLSLPCPPLSNTHGGGARAGCSRPLATASEPAQVSWPENFGQEKYYRPHIPHLNTHPTSKSSPHKRACTFYVVSTTNTSWYLPTYPHNCACALEALLLTHGAVLLG